MKFAIATAIFSPSMIIRGLLIIVLLVALSYGAMLFFARYFSHIMIFHPPECTYVKTDLFLTIELPDGEKITGIYLKAENSKYNIFYSHGNGEDLGMILPLLYEYKRRGISVFAYDYVGYGFNKTRPSEKYLYESGFAAWDYAVKNFGFTPQNTVLIGYSLGSAPTCAIAEKYPDIRAVALVGGISKGSKVMFPLDIIPWKILDNCSKVSNFKSPLLIVHRRSDIIVAPRNAKENFGVAKCPKRVVWLKGDGGHSDMPDTPEYWSEIIPFINNPTEAVSK